MSDIIQLLPDFVANQIAAGEVIERPCSVIKELVENSVDAGAKTINVLVVDAGRTSIQVIDNGKGMSETDARLAFERHATSKIRQAEDLYALQTMGFRGEALPSIAAVAQVEMRTRQETDEVGTELLLSGARITHHQPCACPVGCNITVNNIFYNLPARRKFLRSNATELSNIITAFERIALVYPEISFTLHSNGGETFNLKATTLRQRIADIFGKKLNQDLLPVEADTTICKIKGFVGKPESAKKKCTNQYFFVNGRYMRHPYFAKAIQTAFERLVPVGEQVPYFIYFEVDPSEIEVNIHPTKTEIKFENDQSIWQLLAAAVREAIGVYNDVPTIDFDVHGKPEMPSPDTVMPVGRPRSIDNTSFNPFKTDIAKPKPLVDGWEQLYGATFATPQMPEGDIFGVLNIPEPLDDPMADRATSHYQYKGQYIITSVKAGLLIVDQHRAHVRVLYEQYQRQMEEQKPVSQRMLFPEAVQFSACEAALLETVVGEMETMGFELSPLGACCYAINSVPAGLEGINPSALVQEMISEVLESGSKVKDDIAHTLALSLARKAAIPYGQVLSNDEMEDLVNRLFGCSNVNYTPDGKSVFALLNQTELTKMLGGKS